MNPVRICLPVLVMAMLLGAGPVGVHAQGAGSLRPGQPVAPLEMGAGVPQPAKATAAGGDVAPPVPAAAAKDAILRDGQGALLRNLLWALAGGVLLKLLGRSFFFGLFLGFVLRVVLVAADLVTF